MEMEFKLISSENGINIYESDNDYYCTPIDVEQHLNQLVKIDWSKSLDHKPIDVESIRFVKITQIEHETNFHVIESDNSYTHIIFDSRGGWTEMRMDPVQKRIMGFDHPVLTFIK